LFRQPLTESCLLAILGGVGGTILAFAGVRLLRTLGPLDLPRLDEIGIDLTVMVFTLVLSALTALLFGLVPALHVSRVNQTEVIKSGGSAKGSARKRTRSLIVIAEIAMAVVLLTGGGLLIRSFLKLSNVNLGFDATNVLTFQIALPPPANRSALNENLTEEFRTRVQSLPRVRAVAFTNALPLVPRSSFGMPRVSGTPIPIEGAADVRSVSRNYIATMGLRLTEGRDFGENERAGHPATAIISRAMVRYFGGETPIGKTITLGKREAGIIGIVDDIHERGLDMEPRPQVYVDSRQGFGRETAAFALNWAYFVIRTEGDPASIIPEVRGIVRQMIPGATLRLKVASMEQIVSNSVARPRFYAVLLGLFGVVAVLLATVGVYGITMYSVTQRTREIGIRVAVGAQPWQVLALVLSHSVILTLIGVLIGLGGAVALTRYLEGMLFGLTPLDPATFLLVSIGFGSISILASCIPARRAIKVDPLIALRHE
jgi:predicted permease